MAEISDILGALIGQTVAGGCEDCSATQQVRPHPRVPGVYVLAVGHEDTCPQYRRLKSKGLAE